MDFKIGFHIVVSFLAGYIVAKGTPFYIGSDESKYSKAAAGILLRKK